MLGYKAAKVATAAKTKKMEAPVRPEAHLEEVEKAPSLKRNRSGMPTPVMSHEAALLKNPNSLPTAPSAEVSPLPSLSPPIIHIITTANSSRIPKRCPDLQWPSLECLVGHHLEIFLDFLWALSLSRKTTATFALSLWDLAILLTRSWDEREQGYLPEMPLGEPIVTAQLHSHHSVLYMSAVADKVISSDSLIFRNCYLAT